MQESDFEEYQKQTFKKHEEEIQEIQENMRRELKSSKKDKDAANTDLEQVSIIYLFSFSILVFFYYFSFMSLLCLCSLLFVLCIFMLFSTILLANKCFLFDHNFRDSLQLKTLLFYFSKTILQELFSPLLKTICMFYKLNCISKIYVSKNVN